MRYLTALLLLLSLNSVAGIYKWTDSSGRVHYGDSPADKSKAEKITVDVNSYEHVSYESLYPSQVADSSRVVMYATSWCSYCKKAREYFAQNNIAYVEYDIEKDRAAKDRYVALGGRGVPVILVGNKRMNGFSVDGFRRIYP